MKLRTGKECNKAECIRHESYKAWRPGDLNLTVCMNCKWAFVSQFERKPDERLDARSRGLTEEARNGNSEKG